MKSVMKTAPKPAQTDESFQWRIYYGDELTFDSLMGSPAEAPPTGVICIIYKDRDQGYVTLSSKDYYWYDNDEWLAGDVAGFWQQMFAPGAKIIKFGQSVSNEIFSKVMTMAAHDQEKLLKNEKS